MNSFKNRLACYLANTILKLIATKEYKDCIRLLLDRSLELLEKEKQCQ